MNFKAHYISYRQTGFFSSIINDYLDHDPKLRHFYKFSPDIEGIRNAISERNDRTLNRELLVAELSRQYKGTSTSKKTSANIGSLAEKNTFTICTAHQPNIFTGHLYFLYKIIHIIKLADELNENLSDFHFVPVFYMGSEDADLEELGEIIINGKKYKWETEQKGAVGRMKVDRSFLGLVDEIESQLSVEQFGKEIISIIRSAYTEGITIEDATFELINALFGDYGVVVLLPDNPAFKKQFSPIVLRELNDQFSHRSVLQTISTFPDEYKVQAAGREINLFYLKEEMRERIDPNHQGFKIANTSLRFSKEEILRELEHNPEHFSPNVILRPLFQELILPNVVFVGGGGELAYWLELRKLFEEAGVAYPVLVLRNSFMVVAHKQAEKIRSLSHEAVDFFREENQLVNDLVNSRTTLSLKLDEEKSALAGLYDQVKSAAIAVDATLQKHVVALFKQSLRRIEDLEMKMLKAEKKKFEVQLRQVRKIKSLLFPGGELQERVDNLLPYYSVYGADFIRMIYEYSKGLQQEFCIVEETV